MSPRYGAMNFPVRPVIDEIQSVSKLGFDYFELAMDPPKAHHATLRENAEAVRNTLNEARLGLVCHLPTFVSTADLSPGLRDASVKEGLISLETAAELGAEKVCVHPGHVGGLGRFTLHLCRELALENLGRLVVKAEELGLTLCLENMAPRNKLLTRPEEFAPVFEAFGSLKMTMDVGHAFIAGGQKLIREFIERFGDRIAHVHLNDNHGNQDEHLPLGAGVIDFTEVVDGLKAVGYDETFTFEVFAHERRYLAFSGDLFRDLWESR
jgi:sugar phosphate isomerase/epimerase